MGVSGVRLVRIIGFVCIAISYLSGCASSKGPYTIDLMPAPDVYADGELDPFVDASLIAPGSQPEILFATDRAPAEADDARYEYYSNQRGHVLRLGVAGVHVGHDESVTWDEARRISLLKNRSDQYPLRVASVTEFGPLEKTIRPFDEGIERSAEPGDRFIAEINRRLENSRSQDVYIYVHGYKVDFENAALVSSELWHFLGYNGAFIAYSWPTTAKTLAYFADLESAMASARALRQLIVFISENSRAERIHIVGYSAGTRLVSRTIADLGLLSYGLDDEELEQHIRLGHVILTGSDVDRGVLAGYLLDGVLRLPDSLTLYASGTDKALGMSRFVFGRARTGQLDDIGEVGPSTRAFYDEFDDIRIIDVSNAESSDSGNGHAYFRSSPWVSSDILTTLLYDLEPEQRGLVRGENLPLWRFPPDYLERLRSALREANPELFPD
jgi:esterase/lipase superfamily enzyme